MDRHPRPDDQRQVRTRLSRQRHTLAREPGPEGVLRQSLPAGSAICPPAVGGQGTVATAVRPRTFGVGEDGARVAPAIVGTDRRGACTAGFCRLSANGFGFIGQASGEPWPPALASSSSFSSWQRSGQFAHGKSAPTPQIRAANSRRGEQPDRRSPVSIYRKPGCSAAEKHQRGRLARCQAACPRRAE